MFGIIGETDDFAPLVIRVSVAMICISTIGVTLRLISRYAAKQRFWWDDYTIFLALVSAWLLAAGHMLATKIGGYGQHVDVVGESPSVLRNFLILVYCLQILYPITIAIIKWSVLAFYRRVFAVETTRLPLYIIGAVTAVWAVAVVVVASVACIPVQGFWDKSINARCINTAMYYFAQAIPNVLTDLALLIFPIPLIWNSRLQRSHKISLTCMFAIGALIMILTCLRIVVAIQTQDKADVTYMLVPLGVFNIVETNVAIFLASLPSMGPLLCIALQKWAVKTSFATGSPAKFTPNRSWPRPKRKMDTGLSTFVRLDEVNPSVVERPDKGNKQSNFTKEINADVIELDDNSIPVNGSGDHLIV